MNEPLPLDLLRRIDDAASRFERHWPTPHRVSVEQLLAEFPAEQRSAVLRELWPLETELRRRAGQAIEPHEFERRFPHESALAAEWAGSAAAADATSYHAGGSQATRATGDYSRASDVEGAVLGLYTLERELGAGGMGVVWVARQSQPVKRRVALKLIKRGMDSRDVVRRFELERQALAVLDHPNIARVLDAGVTPDGRPFFAMELVNGLPLTKFCDEARLDTRARLEVFQQICFAVQHAHQKGIIHRDLKPANILVTLVDGRPVPKVIDFGVAKALGVSLSDDSLTTRFGAVIGTLEYMAPEQAGYSGADIDTRADIYALGVILYELLTGLRPFDAARFQRAAFDEMIRVIREEQPFTPSKRLSTSDALPSLAAARQCEPQRLTRTLRGDLDWIAMKCLEKDRNRRYRTADQLADEVRRFLHDEPVTAGPPNQLYLLSKFVKRNRGRVIMGAALAVSLVVGLAVSLWQLGRATRAERAAVRSEAKAVERAAAADAAERAALKALAQSKILAARSARRSQRPGGRTDALARLAEARNLFRDLATRGDAPAATTTLDLRNEVASAWLLPECEFEPGPVVARPIPAIHGVADFPRGRLVEFVGYERQLQLSEWATGKTLATAAGQVAAVTYAEFSDDGNWLYTVGEERRFEVWKVRDDALVPAWSRDGWLVAAHCRTRPLVIATYDGKTSVLYDRATGREIESKLNGTPTWGNPFSADGRKVVLYRDGEMFVCDLETKEEGPRWSPPCDSVRWNAAGDELVTTVDGREVLLRDAVTGRLLHTIGGLRGGARGVLDGNQNFAFFHDWERSAHLHDSRTGRRLLSVPFNGYSGALQMSFRGERLDLLDHRGGKFSALRLSRGVLTEFGPETRAEPVVTRDGALVAAPAGESVRLYDGKTGRLLTERGNLPLVFVLGFEGDALWIRYAPGRAERLPLVRSRAGGVEQIAFGPADRACDVQHAHGWAATPDFQWLAAVDDDADLLITQPALEALETKVTTITTRQHALRHVAISPDGRHVIAGGHVNGGVGLYDRESGALVRLLSESGGWAKFSPDGRFIALSKPGDGGEVWSVEPLELRYPISGSSFQFTPDSRTLAVNDGADGMHLLELATGRSDLRLEIPEGTGVLPAAFTFDASVCVATSSEPQRILRFDLEELRRRLRSFESAASDANESR